MKRLIALLLVLCLMVALVACGTTNQSNDATNSENTSTEQPSDNNSSQTEVALNSFEKLFHDRLYCVQAENELYGYIDISGEYVVRPIYPKANKFDNGLAAVKDPQTGLWGYIDATGDCVIDTQFKEAEAFADSGLAAVLDSDSSLWGFIDKSGKYVIDPQYPEVKDFNTLGLAFAANFDGSWMLIDKKGQQIGSHIYSNVNYFSEGLAVVEVNGLYGYIDETGEYVLEPCAVGLSSFRNARAFRQDQNGNCAMIDKDMNCLTEYLYAKPGELTTSVNLKGGHIEWSEGYCLLLNTVNQNSHIYLDMQGKELAANGTAYYGVADFSEGYAPAAYAQTGGTMEGFSGYIDTNGNWKIEPKFAYAGDFYNGIAVVTVFEDGTYNAQYLMIDTSGNQIADLSDFYNIYEDKRDLLRAAKWIEEGVIGKLGYIDYTGALVIDAIYDNCGAFAEDMSFARVQYNGLWGMIDKEGNWLIEAKFLKLVG